MKVILDAGHGGKDPGASNGSLLEKNITLKLSKMVRDHLDSNFVVDVILTRDSDRFIGLRQRASIANENNTDYFVSIHVNAGGGTGFESYIFSGTKDKETSGYQDILHEHVMDLLRKYNVVNRGQKQANFAVLRETSMPAILLEMLFIDSPQDRELLTSEAFLNNAAASISMGIADVLDLPEKPQQTSNDVVHRIQVGAFESFDNAEQLAKNLNNKGFESFIYEENNLYIVQAGAFKDFDNAEELANKLKAKGFEVYIHP
jgi:N-acetylmuramoyl-L-alanine amidase